MGEATATKLLVALREAEAAVEEQQRRMAACGACVVTWDEAAYPAALRGIADPPRVLFVRGALPSDLPAVAMVGSRKCSHYGMEQAERLGALLAGAGYAVVSGGARGIDTHAHEGCLRHPAGRTVAVLGCGVDIAYPRENAKLFDRIAGRGAVVSELPMGVQPAAENFPRRNRIISGMAGGVLVVEADERGGALITAKTAEAQGRVVMALPGRVDNPCSAGPHALIRRGAVLVTSLEDILAALAQTPGSRPLAAVQPATTKPASKATPTLFPPADAPATAPPVRPPAAPLSELESQVLAALDGKPLHTDAITGRSGRAPHEVLSALTTLTLKGRVKRVDGQTFVRSNA